LAQHGYPEITALARSVFERALAADPTNIEALVGSARADAIAGANLFATDPTSAFAAAEAKLIKALSSVRDHPHAHVLLGFVEICTKRAVEGIAECEHALTLDPNLAHAHAAIGFGKILIGRAEETAAHIGEPTLHCGDEQLDASRLWNRDVAGNRDRQGHSGLPDTPQRPLTVAHQDEKARR
jgi:hypothetical protein